jgi:hypothetical protein
MWKWIQFFDAYRFRDDEAGPGVGFLKLISEFIRDNSKKATAILASTPGAWYMVARSWIILLRTANPAVAYGFDALTIILDSEVVVASLKNTEEFIDGAGGSLAGLASLIVGYIDRISRDLFGLEGEIFDFIEFIDKSLGFRRPQGAQDQMIGPLTAALLSKGAVRSLTRMTHGVMRANQDYTHIPHLIPNALHLIITLFLTPTGFLMIPDALCDGLLYVVVLCGTVGRLNTDLTMLVKNVLASSLTSYATLSVIEDALVAVKEFADRPAFHSSTLFPHWKAFAALADERRLLVQTFNDNKQRRRKICDNVQVTHKTCSASTHSCKLSSVRQNWRPQPLQALFRLPKLLLLFAQMSGDRLARGRSWKVLRALPRLSPQYVL